jgi:hypothetical protein
MGIVYAFALGSLAVRRPWLCGLAVGAAVWAIKALIVLPVTGEGFAGTRHLTLLGLGWFAAAHFLYFFSLTLAYAGLRARPV